MGRPAIVASDGVFSYEDLERASRRAAAGLLGTEHDLEEARVAFSVAPTFAYAATQLGIWRAGGVAVPLALSHPPAELEYVIRDSGAGVVVADRASAATVASIAAGAGARFTLADDLLATTDTKACPFIGAGRRAMIIYTSGTTGRPKGVVTTHQNIGAQIASLVDAWEWRPTDRLLLALPLHHVHGIINGLGSALAVKATCELLPAFDPSLVWTRLASGEITVFTAVPTMYHRLIAAWDAESRERQLAYAAGARRVRLMMSGSAALPQQILERWRKITGHTLLERYGMTEIGMALSNPLHGERRAGFVGGPLPGVESRLVDEAGHDIGHGMPGELEVRGPAVFREYWQRPEETRAAFRDGWFRTGDVAVLENGAYRLLGRTSVDIIKTGGYKVSALEIEDVVRGHPSVADCAVVGIGDAEWGERVSIAIELREGGILSLDDLQRWAKTVLAPYKIPRALRIVSALPRNAMGKVVKPEVSAMFTTTGLQS